MDPLEASSIVFNRIRKLEPPNVTNKIVGYLLLQDRGEEMIRLAFGPDNLLRNLIQRVKIQLGLVPKLAISPPISPSINANPFWDHTLASFSQVSSPPAIGMPNPYWKTHLNSEHQLTINPQLTGLEDQFEPVNSEISPLSSDYIYPDNIFSRGPRSPSEFPVKTCHYFNKGFCKHGNNCRFSHGQPFPESFSQFFSPGSNNFGYEDQVFGYEDQVLSPGSLEKLELEITELLKSRRGSPVSIASLPMLYYEKYGRTLQAEGYLTESQRHGKAGYSLTKLLARLKNSVCLIDRPHGQHSVILAEDAQKYFQYRGDRNDPGPIVSGSRQIYLTFPAESSFSEDDVSDYFCTFGPVQDVRIPCQHKRMFGFVTFASSDTVKMILSKGNPHYVCGARVLVKPYREKSKLADRKYPEKLEPSMFYNSHYTDIDFELHSRLESSRLMRKPFMVEEEEELEAQIRQLSELQLAQKSLVANQAYLGYSMDELRATEGSKFPSAERFDYLLDVLNSGSAADDYRKHTDTNHTHQESSEGVDLPESPFAPPVASSISTVM